MIEFAVKSDIGDRPVNEDSVGSVNTPDISAFILCDGLGGHGMGDRAAESVKTTFTKEFGKIQNPAKDMGPVFDLAQDNLMNEQKEIGAKGKMKTTAVCAVFKNKKLYIGHIGDSRAYIFGSKGIICRTLDHSVPQMLVMSGEISEKEIRNHPDRSSLMRAMGTEWNKPGYELMKPVPERKVKAVLLCSDGFWELIDEERMTDCLERSGSAAEWLEKMSAEVERNGKDCDMDNNSAITVFCGSKR